MRNIIFTQAFIALGILSSPVAFSQTVSQAWVSQYPSIGQLYGPVMARDNSGNTYLAVSPDPENQSGNFLILKYNSSGTLQWNKIYNSPHNNWDDVRAIAVDISGNVIVTGNSKYTSGASSGSVITTVKYNPSGTLLWAAETKVGKISNDPAGIVTDASGNIYIAGSVIDAVAFAYDYLVVKLNSSGNRVWVAKYNGTANGVDIGKAIAIDASGNVYVTGQSEGLIRGRGFPATSTPTFYDYTTLKYDPAGNVLWTSRYYTTSLDIPTAVTVDASNKVYVTGASNGVGTTVAYNSSGTQLWAVSLAGSMNNKAIAKDASGNIIVAGYSAINSQLYYYLAKYTSSGAQVWAPKSYFAGTATSVRSDWNVLLAVDGQSNIYIAGMARAQGLASGIFYNFTTLKYSPAGLQSWVATYNGPTNTADIPSALVLYQTSSPVGTTTYPSIFVAGLGDSQDGNAYGNTTLVKYTQSLTNGKMVAATSTASEFQTAEEEFNTTSPFGLSNYPNSYKGTTTITYTLPNDSHVLLQVYDAAGKTISTPVNEHQAAGTHTQAFHSSRLAAGTYIYRILATSLQGTFTETKQMIVQ